MLLLRVWLADGARTFRGRLLKIDTSVARRGGEERGGEETSVAVVSSARDAAEVVRTWLDRFIDEAADEIAAHDGPGALPQPRCGLGPNAH